MTTTAALIFGLAGVLACGNWWSRVVDNRRVERITKPAVMVCLIGAALLVEPVDAPVRVWFAIALVCSLAGDVFLLGDDRWFPAGLASFLVGHLAYVGGFVAGPTWRWWAVGIAAVATTALVAKAGRQIVAGAAARDPRLVGPVVAYLVIISAMLLAAAAAGNAWAIAGATLFVVSDTILGWNRFVAPRPWMAPTVMITYHLAQAGLVVSLV